MCSPEQSPREQVLAELAALDGAGLPAGALMEQITALAAFAGQVQGELARLAAALEAGGGAQHRGHPSVAALLRSECGLAPAHASEVVAAGRGLARLPATGKALAAGEVSFDQALAVTRTATGILDPPGPADAGQRAAAEAAADAAERVLLDAAAGGVAVPQLRQLGEEIAYRAAPEAAAERERRRWEKRYLSFGLTVDDTGTISGACGDTVTFETIRTAAEAFGPPGGTMDARTAAQRRLDGLAAACKAALDTGGAPFRHGAAPHISVLVHDQTLAQAGQRAHHGGPAPGGVAAGGAAAGGAAGSAAAGTGRGAPPARTGHGQMLTAAQVLGLCCGAELTAIRWEDGLPLDVGRAARTEPPALRKALEARDRTCRWPGCETPAAWATGHHIRGWTTGARTSLGEICLLCHVHHAHFIHLLGWVITGDPNATLHFTHPGGGLTLHSPLPGNPHPP
jgi:hypothetical protein